MTGTPLGATPGPSLTLVVAVYNAVRPLELIFHALDRQTFGDFEVVVADDGSGPAVAELVERRRATSRYHVSHVWHPDRGFRKNAILNRAIAAARSGYLVFIDGDCLPHRRFLEDHSRQAEQGAVLCGRRVNLGRAISEKITPESVESGSFERISLALLADGLRGGSAWIEDAVRTESPLLRKLLHPGKPAILGCNFSVHREWLERINGFNEEYAAPGLGEDSDVAYRLGLAGAGLASLRNLGILFHLHHPKTAVGEENRKIYESVVASREMVCRNGLVKLSSAVYAG
ncbi:MAG TPA: glycosyltransferase [Bacteroidota bacterium]|nr:glycosyltransferase [Bacteroidota bacterium]